MYLCFVDESGTHGASPVLVVGGIIVHEEDVWHLQQRLGSFLFRRLRILGHDHTEFELHGSEIWRGGKQWGKVDQNDRRRILSGPRLPAAPGRGLTRLANLLAASASPPRLPTGGPAAALHEHDDQNHQRHDRRSGDDLSVPRLEDRR